MNRKKADIKNKHESLEVLRSKLTLQAEELLVNVFKESLKESNAHKMNTEEMFEELNKEKNHLSHIANDLKEKNDEDKTLKFYGNIEFYSLLRYRQEYNG